MRIYPSPHIITKVEHPDFLHIPLSSMDETYVPDSVIVTKEEDFLVDKKTDISPYTKINNIQDLFFDENNNIVEPFFHLKNNQYSYVPSSITEFVPEQFTFRSLIQRMSTYKTDVDYNIDVAVDNIDNWKDLISIFGDAPSRGIGPHNVYVNGGDCNDSSLKNGILGKTDFYFIRSDDGIKYLDNPDEDIDVMEFINGHTNVWLAIDECDYLFDGYSISCAGHYEATSLDKAVYDTVKVSSGYRRIINQKPKLPFDLNNSNGFVTHVLFTPSPLLVYEKENKGFLIVSNSRMFDYLEDHAHIIYETMMWVYLHAYKESESFSSWITNDNVQSIGKASTPLNRKHKILNENTVANTVYGIRENALSYVTRQIIMEEGDVFYSSRDSNMNMNFSKLSSAKIDPRKEDGYTSILTLSGSVIYCKDNTLLTIEPNVEINTGIDGDACSVAVSPFCSSKYRLKVDRKIVLSIPDNNKTYYLTAQAIDDENKSVLRLEESSSWKGNTIKIATVKVQMRAMKICHDIRVAGGGLPKTLEDDYDMLDIGNLYGRMYRKGNSLIIRLPEYLKPYDKYIRESIEAWKNASTLVIIHYE